MSTKIEFYDTEFGIWMDAYVSFARYMLVLGLLFIARAISPTYEPMPPLQSAILVVLNAAIITLAIVEEIGLVADMLFIRQKHKQRQSGKEMDPCPFGKA